LRAVAIHDPETTMAESTSSGRISRRRVLAGLGASGALLTQPAARALAEENTMPDNAQCSRHLTVHVLRAASGLHAGDWAETMGFHEPGDGGDALYRIRESVDGEAPDDRALMLLTDGLVAELVEAEAVNYRMFGALGDGQADDGVAIRAAHAWANAHDLPVLHRTGEFWIGDTHGIEIRTPVDWGKTIFHIDERTNSQSEPRFVVRNDRPTVDLPLDDALKSALIDKIRPGVQLVPELAPWSGHLLTVTDEDDRIGIRAGNYSKRGWARQELFYVEEEGRIVGDIAWAFRDFTSVRATPCNDNVLVVEGGCFYFSGDSPQNSTPGYHHHGILIERSRTIVRNQWMGLEPGRTDDSMEPRSGCYILSGVYDVTLESIRCMPWEKNREGQGRDVAHGTYGIGGARMLNCTFRNLTAEAGWVSWGVFGTNLNKNFRVENCRLNRIDVHFHCWNLTIRDCEIGFKGISVTGGGDLLIENTVRHGNSFVSFRSDYGSRWDGRVHLRGCTLRPTGEGRVAVLQYNPQDFDYQYQIGYGRDIEIQDLRIDYAAAPASTAPCWLMQVADFSRTSNGSRLFFPKRIGLRRIHVVGRVQGVRLLRLPDPSHFDLGAEGGEADGLLRSNCEITCDDVHLERVTPGADVAGSAHLVIGSVDAVGTADANALIPKLHFSNCDGLVVTLLDCAASVLFERCVINLVRAPGLHGDLSFADCRMRPDVADAMEGDFYETDVSSGTRFTNCTLHAPVVDGHVAPELVDRMGIVQVNGVVRHYHLNTGLGGEVLAHLAANDTVLTPDFIANLRCHHALET
jgi:hypothetical protein